MSGATGFAVEVSAVAVGITPSHGPVMHNHA